MNDIQQADPPHFVPTQSTLADEFLRDFGAPDEEEVVPVQENGGDEDDVSMQGVEEDALAAAFAKKTSGATELDADTLKLLTRAITVHELVKIAKSEELAALLADIDVQLKLKEKLEVSGEAQLVAQGNLEEDPEYEIITRGNDMNNKLSTEINVVHRFIQDIYRARWPELESLVPSVMDYVRCVKKLGNNLHLARVELAELLPSASIISLSVAATTTSGKALSEEDLAKVLEACEVVFDLDATRKRIIAYIESRMKFYAPNLSALIGTNIAAKLISIAGGLTNLARTVSGNVQALGIAKKGSLNGMSTATSLTHVGYIVESELIQNCPQHLFKKAYRLVSGKCSIAARVDSFHSSPLGQVGAGLRDDIERKIDKWQEPPPARKEKPLPLPEAKKMKHRAGRKVQAKKASYAMTELQKRAARLKFGVLADEVGNEPDRDFGMLSQEGHGLLRIAANMDNKGFKIKAPKEATKKKGGQKKNDLANAAGSSNTGGAATYLTSGEAKAGGLRTLVGQEAAAQAQAQSALQARLAALKSANSGYFSQIGTFTSTKQ